MKGKETEIRDKGLVGDGDKQKREKKVIRMGVIDNPISL